MNCLYRSIVWILLIRQSKQKGQTPFFPEHKLGYDFIVALY